MVLREKIEKKKICIKNKRYYKLLIISSISILVSELILIILNKKLINSYKWTNNEEKMMIGLYMDSKVAMIM